MSHFCRVALLMTAAVAMPWSAIAQTANTLTAAGAAGFPAVNENDNNAPVDFGYGPGVKPPKNHVPLPPGPLVIATGSSTAGTQGMFSTVVSWPIVAIHMILLPSGQVMSYGTDQNGVQGGQFIYDIWNPSLGTDSNAHLVLPNTTSTNIFCSGQSMMWGSGETLITGGSTIVNGVKNYSINNTTIFDPQTNTISNGAAMQYPRWYGSIVPLPNGEMLVLGGRTSPTTSALTPEVYNPTSGWRTLTGATSSNAFTNYYYPRGYVGPNGLVFMLHGTGVEYSIDPTGTGSIVTLTGRVPSGNISLPTVMFGPGKLLSVRQSSTVVSIDLNGTKPVSTTTGNISQNRFWSHATVLADGEVLVDGGSLIANKLTGVAYQTEIWNPATGTWSFGAAATKPRLYHSNALLMPDGSVLTAGGGAPGPVKNLNAEIYYPPYLYLNDGSGMPAPRPTLASVPASVSSGQPLNFTVGSGNNINRVTFVRTGSSTHTNNVDQRFLDLPFTQSGASVTATLPTNTNILLPGYWMLFAWQNGAPSLADIVLVPN